VMDKQVARPTSATSQGSEIPVRHAVTQPPTKQVEANKPPPNGQNVELHLNSFFKALALADNRQKGIYVHKIHPAISLTWPRWSGITSSGISLI
jgi:hypothetical protein